MPDLWGYLTSNWNKSASEALPGFFFTNLHFGIGFAIIHIGSSQKIFRRIPMELIKRFVREEEGQGLVEYALIIGLIAVVAIAALTLAGTSINAIFTSIGGKLDSTASNIS